MPIFKVKSRRSSNVKRKIKGNALDEITCNLFHIVQLMSFFKRQMCQSTEKIFEPNETF